MSRPDFVKQEHLEYLDRLRESGVTNMFGSPAFVARRFDIKWDLASDIVGYWMETFGDENR